MHALHSHQDSDGKLADFNFFNLLQQFLFLALEDLLNIDAYRVLVVALSDSNNLKVRSELRQSSKTIHRLFFRLQPKAGAWAKMESRSTNLF